MRAGLLRTGLLSGCHSAAGLFVDLGGQGRAGAVAEASVGLPCGFEPAVAGGLYGVALALQLRHALCVDLRSSRGVWPRPSRVQSGSRRRAGVPQWGGRCPEVRRR